MTPEQIAALSDKGEAISETLELKRSTRLLKEGTQSVCAMLNHKGGYVLFGVEDDGRVIGQQIGNRTIEEVTQELRIIEPPIFPAIESVLLDNGLSVIVVTVHAGQNRPYSYQGRAYRRFGNTNRVMSRDEYNQILLERMHNEQRWENHYADGWSAADLDLTELRRMVGEAILRGRLDDPGSREPDDLLRGLGLVKDGRLLRAAPVLFGRRERVETELTQCLLRVARFRGIDRTEFHDSRQFYGNAFDLFRQAERYLRENLPIAGRIVPNLFERIDDPLYPLEALREVLANAICHRDYTIGGGSVAIGIYDDRLEVTSSGSLHFGLTPEQLFAPHESLPWNPLIARVFYRRGIIEEWGRGTIKIAELTSSAGLPKPEIEDLAGSITVRFRPGRYVPPQRVGLDITERQQAILALLDTAPSGLALREIIGRLPDSGTERQVREDLATLRTLNLALPFGHGRGARWRRL